MYHARVGLAYTIAPTAGLSLGTGIDGVPVRNVIGGDEGFSAPGYTLHLDPGVALARGMGTFAASIPFRLHGEFKQNLNDLAGGPGSPGDRGDLASYLIFVGYAHRF